MQNNKGKRLKQNRDKQKNEAQDVLTTHLWDLNFPVSPLKPVAQL